MHRLALVLLFFVVVVAAECPNNCSNKGECVDNACVCINLHEGEDCSGEWRFLHKGWKELFGVYVTLGVLLMLSCVVFTIVLICQDFLSNQSSAKKRISNVSVQVSVLVCLGSLSRVLYLTIDPHGVWGFMPRAADGFLWNVAIVSWMNAFYLLILYWIEIVTLSKLRVSPSVRKMKPALLVGIVVTCLTILPLGIWSEVERSFRALITYYAIVVILLLFLIGFSAYHGIRLLTTIAATSKAVGTKQTYRDFVDRVTKLSLKFTVKVTRLLLVTNGMLIGLVIVSIAYVFWGGSPFPFIGFSIAGRLLEWGAVFWVLLFLTIKKPKRIASSPSLQSLTNMQKGLGNSTNSGVESGAEVSAQTSRAESEVVSSDETEGGIDLPKV